MVVVPRRTRGAMLHDGAMHSPDRSTAAFTQGRCASAQFAAMLGVQPLRSLRRLVVAQPREQPFDVVDVPKAGALVGVQEALGDPAVDHRQQRVLEVADAEAGAEPYAQAELA